MVCLQHNKKLLLQRARGGVVHTGTSISAANSTCLSLLPAVQVEPRELVVPAGGEASVLVRVLLDDAAAFKDTLHVLVSEGADVPVALDATGVGDTVVSAALSQPQLDFGPQFVGRGWQTEVEVTNMGRKPVTLTWTNRRLAEVMDTLNKAAKAAGTLCWWQPACRAATVCRKHRRLIATRMPTAQQPVPTERSSCKCQLCRVACTLLTPNILMLSMCGVL